jgi:two-component system, OmpR family, alkaline phosphatase synthesis response regulator PhoP
MKHRRVLIIDDEQAIQVVAQFSLKMVVGWEVLTASSGLAGLAMAQTEAPDLILLDVMMPGMDGLATFKALQQQPQTRSIPVIFLTAKGQVAAQRLLDDPDVAGVIMKPFNSFDLATQIVKVLGW